MTTLKNVVDLESLSKEEGLELIEKIGLTHRTTTSAAGAQIADDFCCRLWGVNHLQGIGFLGSTLRGTSYDINSPEYHVVGDIDVIGFIGNYQTAEQKMRTIQETYKRSKKSQEELDREVDLQLIDLDVVERAVEERGLHLVFYDAIIDTSKIIHSSPYFQDLHSRIKDTIAQNHALHQFDLAYREAGKGYGLGKHSLLKDVYAALFLNTTRTRNDNTFHFSLLKSREI